MRRISTGAIGSNHWFRLGGNRARVLTVTFPLGLMLGYAQPAAAASDLQLEQQFVATHVLTLQPGPGVASNIAPAREPAFEPASSPSSAEANTYSEEYWGAFANIDLGTLRASARGESESRFASAMGLLATGYYDLAEHALLEISEQTADPNVAVASQVMLASTLQYQHKWSKLRDLPLHSHLTEPDKRMTSELEQWGRVFAAAPAEVIHFPADAVTLRLGLTPVGTPTIRVRINGKDYDFWLDTGSSMTVISSDVAAATGMRALSPDVLSVKTFSGFAPVNATTVESLEIGAIKLTNSPAVIIDAALMYLRASADGVPARGIAVDGIIGWDTIRQLDLVMNYAERKITLKKPNFLGNSGGAEQSLAWLGKPLVEVTAKGGGKFHFMLDTGAQSTFLNATVLEKVGMFTKNTGTRVYGLAHTGSETNRVVPSLTLEVAGKSLGLENVLVYGPVPSGLINCDGILGSDVARFGTIHIDATNGLFSVGLLDDAEDSAE
jgi:predicted aspartyl protease